MATRGKFRRICGGSLIALAAIAFFSCAVKHEIAETQPVVWRASESNGDKPGVGYEIVEAAKLSGSFLLFEPSKPHDFDTATRIPMTLVKVSANEYRANVRAPSGGMDELSIRFVGQPDASTRKAVVQQLNRPSAPQDFTFVRQH